MPLRQFHIKGFKSIVDETVELGRVNCFIGANGAGKSNVLEALGLLGAATGGRVDDESLIRRGVRAGLPKLFKSSFASGESSTHILVEATGRPDATYRCALQNPLDRPVPAWRYKSESLSSGDAQLVSRNSSDKNRLNRDDFAGLAALKVVDLQASDPASVLLKALQSYAIYTPNTPALRAAVADPQTRQPVGLSGGRLAEAFEELMRSAQPDHVDDALGLIDWISDADATDAVSGLLSSSVARAKRVLRFTDRHMRRRRNTLTAYDASEGSLYVLFTAVLCLSAASPTVFAVDNLDSALNPRLAKSLVRSLSPWLRAADPNRQLLFTAHNPAALDGLDLEDEEVRLFAVERNSEGHTRVRRVLPTEEFLAQSKAYPLSRLWAMGNLGAVDRV